MNKFLKLIPFLVLSTACGSAVEYEPVDSTGQEPKQTTCHEFGEAPDVVTIRAPHGAQLPHPDCSKLDELSPAGQDVYCCTGDAFKKWYGGALGS